MQSTDASKRSAQQVGQPDATAMPANKVPRTSGAGEPRRGMPNQPMRTSAGAPEAAVQTGARNVLNTAANPASRKVLSWVGSIVGNEV